MRVPRSERWSGRAAPLKFGYGMPIRMGMEYRFRLERIRALRERREDAAKLEFAGALQLRGACERELTAAEVRIADARLAQLQPSAGLMAGDLQSRQHYLERLERVQHSVQERLQRQQIEVEARRAALTRASQAREALERLKQKSLAAQAHELARVEQNALDEIASSSHRRRVLR